MPDGHATPLGAGDAAQNATDGHGVYVRDTLADVMPAQQSAAAALKILSPC